MKHLNLFLACLIGAASANAAITFSSQTFRQTNASDAIDETWVSTSGTLLDATNVSGATTSVGGVTWTGRTGDEIDWKGSGTTAHTSLSEPNVAYASSWNQFFTGGTDLLTTGGYGDNKGALVFNNLVADQQYLVQLVLADSRGGSDGRNIAISEATVSGATVTDSGTPLTGLQYACSDAAGDTGFVVVDAVFTNDADFKGAISLDVSSGAEYQLNAYQLRAIPEPSSMALLGLGGLALILRRRK